MDLGEYLLKNVSPKEIERLRERRDEMVSSVRDSFNDVHRPRIEGIDVTFRYNPKRCMIGFFVGPKREEMRLVVNDEGLSTDENSLVVALYDQVRERLDYLRLPNEEWID